MRKENQSLDVLIINSPLFRYKVKGYDEDSLPPLGLGYIATDLLSSGKIIDEIEYNKDLSVNIGRKQFNFTSGNFSEVSDEVLRMFITKTNEINR